MLSTYIFPKRLLRNKKVISLKSTKLDLPNTESTKVYGVIVKFFPKELQLHYKINVKRIQNTIEFVKEKTYINNQEITKVVEQIFEKSRAGNLPVENYYGSQWRFIKKLIILSKLQKRWISEYRPKLKEYYVSESADEIIDELDKALIDVEARKNLLTKKYIL